MSNEDKGPEVWICSSIASSPIPRARSFRAVPLRFARLANR
jgi:hypothetical protein